jgi:adenosine/AMP kinase
MDDRESWDSWRTHVLSEIKRTNDSLAFLTATVSNLHVETAKLQVKSGVWGVIGGMIPVIVVIVIEKTK